MSFDLTSYDGNSTMDAFVKLIEVLPELIVLSAIAWFLYRYGDLMREIAEATRRRIIAGAPLKIANIVDFGPIATAPNPRLEIISADTSGRKDDGLFERKRLEHLAVVDNFFIIHNAHPLDETYVDEFGKLWRAYDIIIYILAYWDKSLIGIESVEYFFGEGWDNLVFESAERYNSFAIRTKTYGSFLCVARLHFVDETIPKDLYKFIDLEMPVLGSRATTGGV